VGDVLKPKSFAGLLGAAPSVALATMPLTIARDGLTFGGTEVQTMIFGAIAFVCYAAVVSYFLWKKNQPALLVTLTSLLVWLAVAFGLFELAD
jgi:ABC-type xylose transport system permease subunit